MKLPPKLTLSEAQQIWDQPSNPDELRVLLVRWMRWKAAVVEGMRKCGGPIKGCGSYLVYLPYTHAIAPGHIYSDAGVREVSITGMCEFCFDEVTAEPEEDEDD